jgi:predicted double-glycine peptidase
MSGEFYIQVGLTTLRQDDFIFADIPLYIKVHELQENGLAKMENDLLKTIGEIVAKTNASNTIERIEAQKQDEQTAIKSICE